MNNPPGWPEIGVSIPVARNHLQNATKCGKKIYQIASRLRPICRPALGGFCYFWTLKLLWLDRESRGIQKKLRHMPAKVKK